MRNSILFAKEVNLLVSLKYPEKRRQPNVIKLPFISLDTRNIGPGSFLPPVLLLVIVVVSVAVVVVVVSLVVFPLPFIAFPILVAYLDCFDLPVLRAMLNDFMGHIRPTHGKIVCMLKVVSFRVKTPELLLILWIQLLGSIP
ncbi:hypothetical protein Tco_0527083 [Tanacetum coccineum]